MKRFNSFILLLIATVGGMHCGDPNLSDYSAVTLAEVLADPASFDGRQITIDVRLGLGDMGFNDECLIDGLIEDPCCGSWTWFVEFGDPGCPFEDWRSRDVRGRLLEPETRDLISYPGDRCSVNHAPLDLLGPEVEFELGAKYTVRGIVEFFWSTDGEPYNMQLLRESIVKVGPRCSE